MDVMQLRRGLMMGMGSSNVIKGSFTCPDSGGSYTIDFGRTIRNAILYIEMSEESKQILIASGQNGKRTYATVTKYPAPSINDGTPSVYNLVYRYDPTSLTQDAVTSREPTITFNGTSVAIPLYGMGTVYGYYRGLTYNYAICFLD